MTDIHEDMQKLATLVAKKALEDATDFELRLDAFKQLTAFYALMLKHETADEDDDGATFVDFSKRLQESEHGGPAENISGRRPSSRRAAAQS